MSYLVSRNLSSFSKAAKFRFSILFWIFIARVTSYPKSGGQSFREINHTITFAVGVVEEREESIYVYT